MSKLQDPSVRALIEAARVEYATSLAVKIGALLARAESGAWEEVRREAHKLRGSAGVHGFRAISDLAAAVEELLLDSAAPAAPARSPEASAQQRVRVLLEGLRDEGARVGREGT